VTCETEGLSWSASFRGDLLGGTHSNALGLDCSSYLNRA
jgi:hypothetical protein